MTDARLFAIVYTLNTAIDCGKVLGIDLIENLVDDGSIVAYLEKELSDKGLGLIHRTGLTDQEQAELTSEWQAMFAGPGRDKLGVHKQGLCLLLAYTLCVIQERVRARKQVAVES